MIQLTIVIPTHNRPDMLKNAIDSVVSQTLTEWELIVVDDGSSTTMSTVVDSYRDARIRLHRHESPQGASAARNTGFRLAEGDYTAFLDDDDTLDPKYAEQMLQAVNQFEQAIDISWPALSVIDVMSGKTSLAQHLPCVILAGQGAEPAFAAVAYTRTTGMMFRTDALRKAGGFDESLPVSEDRELLFRMLSAGASCTAVTSPLVNFYIHSGPRLSTSENLARQANCDAVIAHRHAQFIADHPLLASRYLNLLARRQKSAGQYQEYRQTLRTLLAIRPFDFRARKRLLLSAFKAR